MTGGFTLGNVAWGLSLAFALTLLVVLLLRKAWRDTPLFLLYIIAVLLQGIALITIYRAFGYQSLTAWYVGWGSQALVIVLRATAVGELSRRMLIPYAGIWGFGKRILLGLGALILLLALIFGRESWNVAVLTADRALELTIAGVVAGLFVFARYYRLPYSTRDLRVALGFCLYSSFFVINDTILSRYLTELHPLWNFLGSVSYIASVALWIRAYVRQEVAVDTVDPLKVAGTYGQLSPELNLRLRLLNDQLSSMLDPRKERP